MLWSGAFAGCARRWRSTSRPRLQPGRPAEIPAAGAAPRMGAQVVLCSTSVPRAAVAGERLLEGLPGSEGSISSVGGALTRRSVRGRFAARCRCHTFPQRTFSLCICTGGQNRCVATLRRRRVDPGQDSVVRSCRSVRWRHSDLRLSTAETSRLASWVGNPRG